MAKLVTTVAFMALLAITISAVPDTCKAYVSRRKRLRRGFNNSAFGSGSEYGRGSDERDTSSQEGGNGCNSDNSRSRELSYNRDGRQSNENNRGGRSFAKSSASASATAFNENHGSKNFIV